MPVRRITCFSCALLNTAAFLFLLRCFMAPKSVRKSLYQSQYLFWWESISILAFAIDWLAKGHAEARIVDTIRTARNRLRRQ